MKRIDEKSKKIVFSGLVFFVFLVIAYALNRKHKINNNGVFVIAKFVKREFGGKPGPKHYYFYYYSGRRYEKIFTGRYAPPQYMYFKILPENPTKCMVLFDKVVPSCLTIDSSPQTGWVELPSKDTCDK